MCGRFTLHHSTDEIAARFAAQQVMDIAEDRNGHPAPSFEEPRYNIAPSQAILAVRAEQDMRRLETLQWGLVPSWAKDVSIGSKMINARGETLAEKPSFRNALMRRRCLIPADGFYEWKKDDRGRQPMHIHRRDGGLFAFAGLWEEWRRPDGPPLRTCTIITVAPNELMAEIHDRMPAILREEDEAVWLDTEQVTDKERILSLLRPYPDAGLEAYPVSKLVNAPVNDSAECLSRL